MVPVACLALVACSSAKPPVNEEPSALPGQTKGVAPAASLSSDTASVRSFVQGFYDWYLPIVNKGGTGTSRVLQERDSLLTTELAVALRADFLAEEQADPGETVGLNFDPFLNSQDPCPRRWEVIGILQKGSNYAVTVHPVCASASHELDVVAEVTKQGPSWRFVNFFYGDTDLRKLLCQYATKAGNSAWQKASCSTP